MAIKTDEPEVIEIGIEGPVGAQGPASTIPGPPGPAGGSVFEHDHPIASAVWNINHGLGRHPGITVVDTAGDLVEGDVHYVDVNNVTLTFASAFSGKAFFS